jgi:hypothetical protein
MAQTGMFTAQQIATRHRIPATPAQSLELASACVSSENTRMKLPEAEQDFLRELVKTSRQRLHHVRWKDRDGTERITTLSQADAARLNALARELGVSKEAVLLEAAHLPALKRTAKDAT